MKSILPILLLLPLIAGIAPFTSPTDKGNDAYHAGKYDDALDSYKNAVEADPGKAVPHYNLGDAYYKKGDYNNALTEYRRAIALDPKMPDAYYNAGDSLYRLGRYDDALKSYQQADSLRKNDADTGHNIELTMKRVKEQKEKPPQPKGPQSKQGQGQGGHEKKGSESRQQAQTGQGQGSKEPQSGQPGMSNEELQALLDRQSKEEKSLRNYFQPGRKDERTGRDAEIEQMLRGFGLSGMMERPARPGAPSVEKDW